MWHYTCTHSLVFCLPEDGSYEAKQDGDCIMETVQHVTWSKCIWLTLITNKTTKSPVIEQSKSVV